MIRALRDRLKTKFVERKRRPLPDPVPTLPVIREPIFRTTSTAIEKFVTEIYGFEFSIESATGQVAGTLEYTVTGKLDSPAWEDRAEDLRAGRRKNDLRLILATLSHDGLIPKGRLLIEIVQSA